MNAGLTSIKILIRADASAVIGTGHLMRCLALAQAAQDRDSRVAFVCREIPDVLGERLRDENLPLHRLKGGVGTVEDAAETWATAREIHADWIVVDGYRFGPDYYAALHGAGARVLAVDDMAHCANYPVDLLLNQNLHVMPELYSGKIASTARLLLGPKFSLLRREFRAYATWRRDHVDFPRRVLVSFGGSDAENFTGRVLRALARSVRGGIEVLVLAGAANHAVPELTRQAAELPFTCEIRVNVRDVAAVMAWADVAISAGGSTVWELAAMRLPALVTGLSPDQRLGLDRLESVAFFRTYPAKDLSTIDLDAVMQSLFISTKEFDINDLARWQGIDTLGVYRVLEKMSEISVKH